MYIGDPHRVPAITPDSRNRAKPKSAEQNTIIISNVIYYLHTCMYLQCFDAVGWAAGRASGL